MSLDPNRQTPIRRCSHGIALGRTCASCNDTMPDPADPSPRCCYDAKDAAYWRGYAAAVNDAEREFGPEWAAHARGVFGLTEGGKA